MYCTRIHSVFVAAALALSLFSGCQEQRDGEVVPSGRKTRPWNLPRENWRFYPIQYDSEMLLPGRQP